MFQAFKDAGLTRSFFYVSEIRLGAQMGLMDVTSSGNDQYLSFRLLDKDYWYQDGIEAYVLANGSGPAPQPQPKPQSQPTAPSIVNLQVWNASTLVSTITSNPAGIPTVTVPAPLTNVKILANLSSNAKAARLERSGFARNENFAPFEWAANDLPSSGTTRITIRAFTAIFSDGSTSSNSGTASAPLSFDLQIGSSNPQPQPQPQPRENYPVIAANTYDFVSGSVTPQSGGVFGGFDAPEYVHYSNVTFSSSTLAKGACGIRITYSRLSCTAGSWRGLPIKRGGTNGGNVNLGGVSLNATGSSSNYQTVTLNLPKQTGVDTLFLHASGGTAAGSIKSIQLISCS